MKFEQATLQTCAQARGVVVVIDVLRAFSTAAYALAGGASEITLVGTVEEAFELRARQPGSLIMGEVEGLPVNGFDFSNSPTEIAAQDLQGRRLIQRTSAGTQGIILSRQAGDLFAVSMVCAQATALAIKKTDPESVTFVITGLRPGGYGDEDKACADYIEALLCGEQPDPDPYIRRVRSSVSGRRFEDPSHPEFSASDLDYCTAVDRFDFAMPVERREGGYVLKIRNIISL